MTKPAHTPGPWNAGRPDMATMIEGRPGKYIYAGKKPIAAAGFGVKDWGEVMANARLIAAAPDMYEALEAMFEARHACSAEWTDACLMAARALRKARGEE